MTKKTSRQTRSASRQQKLSRRAIMAAAAAVPLVQLSADAAAGPEVTANLIERARRKNAAFMRGDM